MIPHLDYFMKWDIHVFAHLLNCLVGEAFEKVWIAAELMGNFFIVST